MNKELYLKLNKLIDYINDMLVDIKVNGKKARDLKKTVSESRKTVIEVLEIQLGGISLEEQINISEIPDEDWVITARHIVDIINESRPLQNQYEVYFMELFNYITKTSKEQLLENLKNSFENLRKNASSSYERFVKYFSDYPLWGTFDPENGDYNTFELRASVLKHHAYDFLWLYMRLNDYISKRTLSAILINWADLQTEQLYAVKSIFRDYWEPDIFPNNTDDVMVDLGAYVGDSIANYIQIYGKGYKKIYAYEISEDTYNELCKNIKDLEWHDVDARRKGAGAVRSYMFVHNSEADASANNLEKTGDKDSRVAIVPLDDDLEEIPTLINLSSRTKKAVNIAKQGEMWYNKSARKRAKTE